MYQVVASNQFGKDYKRCIKRHLPINILDAAVLSLAENVPLPPKYKVHKLEGDYINCWECHLLPDWLLIWQYDLKNETIYLVRTGSHSDLFK